MARLETGLERFEAEAVELFGNENPFTIDRPADVSWWQWLTDVLERIVPALVPIVEGIAGPGNGEEKKDLLLEALVQLYLTSGLDIPWVPRSVEIWILRFIGGKLIDEAVDFLNDRDWL